jgi:type I restriction enzyme S subunit
MKKRYSNYKPSGVEWIGEVPSHWEIMPLKYNTNIVLGKMLTPENRGGQVIKLYLRSQNIQSENCDVSDVKEMWFSPNELEDLRVKMGDLLVNEGGDVGRTSIWKNEIEEVYIQNSVNKVRILNGNPRYYLFQFMGHHSSGYFESIVNRVSIPHLTKEKLSNINFIAPPLSEQEQIVKYLDEKTAEIDKLVAITERKIDLLKEKRTALINETVTKGLNRNAEMRDSGIEWIGEVPSHWSSHKLKHLSEIKISSVDKHIFDDELQVSVCHYTDVYYNEFIDDSTELKIGSCTQDEFYKFQIGRGDVLLTKDSESPSDIGIPCLVRTDLENTVCGYHIAIIKPYHELNGGYLFRQLLSKRLKSYFEVSSNGITRFGLGKSSIEQTLILLPPLSEQEQIVKYLDEKTAEIDKLVAIEQRRILTLKEYRQCLINEVVTGKVRVSDEQAEPKHN